MQSSIFQSISITFNNHALSSPVVATSHERVLSGQAEFNVEISDWGAPVIVEQFFDKLWEDSIQITEHDESKTELIKPFEKETLTREITPFEAYALALKPTLMSIIPIVL